MARTLSEADSKRLLSEHGVPVLAERLVSSAADAAVAHPELVSADVNPMIIVDGRPVAVDALVELNA